jgi:hypothetical protein
LRKLTSPGLHSVGSTLAFCLADSLESTSSHVKSTSYDYLIEAAPRVDEAGVASVADLSCYALPHQDFARRSIEGESTCPWTFSVRQLIWICLDEAYFRNVHSFYPVVDRGTFCSSWEQLYKQQATQRPLMEFLLLYLIVSIGAVCNDVAEDMLVQRDEISQGLYRQAWELQPQAYGKPSSGTVQLLLLHVSDSEDFQARN